MGNPAIGSTTRSRESAGDSTLLCEHAPPDKRGYLGSHTQPAVHIGLFLGAATFLLIERLGPDVVPGAGWHVPPLSSLALNAVSLYVRLHVAAPAIGAQPACYAKLFGA